MKSLLIRLSNNQRVLEVAKKIFIYYPSLKYKLIEYAYSSSKKEQQTQINYTSNFFDDIKQEVEARKNIKGYK